MPVGVARRLWHSEIKIAYPAPPGQAPGGAGHGDFVFRAPYQHVAGAEVRELRGTLTDRDEVRLYDSQRPDVSAVVAEWLRAQS